MTDLSIINGTVFTETGLLKANISVKNGKITQIGEKSTTIGSERVIDASGKLVIPGLVDLHVHFREPGFTQKEDFLTGTRAAAAGGVTTVVDEPNNKPVTNSLETLRKKKKLVEGKAYVDYTFSVALYADTLDQVKELRMDGINAFAVFDELGDKPTGMNDTRVLLDALEKVKAADGVALLNCRESDLVVGTMGRLKASSKTTLEDYNDHFPHVAESIGAAKRILLADWVGVKTHMREVSTLETVEVLKQLSPYMGGVTAEVRPDHLFLNRENAADLGPFAQQWTPLRRRKDSEALWGALNDGTVNVIASDHATHTKAEKERGLEDIWASPPGLPAIESMLPLLLTRVNEGVLELSRLVEAASVNPAKVIGQYPRKGCISVGSDADLVIVDLNAEKVIRGKDSKAKTHWTPFEGWKVKGLPVATFVRGIETFVDGEIVGKPGQGRFLPA
ncbi:MAG: dihydroorotase family protein [Candidatus Bathyarchaeota archaeon]|nr:dihydroorotase family protein [Candidatus Bathyarchaeota archaeon]